MENTLNSGEGYFLLLTLPAIGEHLGGNSFNLGPGVLLAPLDAIAKFVPLVGPMSEFIYRPDTYALHSDIFTGLVHSALTAIQITRHVNCEHSLLVMLTPDYKVEPLPIVKTTFVLN